MAVTTPVYAGETPGVGYDSSANAGGANSPNPCVNANTQLCFPGQTANTSASNVGSQGVGTVQIPSGTTDGATVTITNRLISLKSLIFLQARDNSGKKLMLDTVVPAAGSATFTVRTVDAAATTSNCDVWFLIIN